MVSMRKVEFIVFPAVVLAEESLNRAPRSLDGVGVGPDVRMTTSVRFGTSAIALRTHVT